MVMSRENLGDGQISPTCVDLRCISSAHQTLLKQGATEQHKPKQPTSHSCESAYEEEEEFTLPRSISIGCTEKVPQVHKHRTRKSTKSAAQSAAAACVEPDVDFDVGNSGIDFKAMMAAQREIDDFPAGKSRVTLISRK
ncbi:MAG: hypothetical protein P4L69_03350 [Desulfosporosinus sp.]|nr:hypothetical protein [Desulfosporosinus sp.]